MTVALGSNASHPVSGISEREMQLRQVEVLLKSAVALTRTKLRWVRQVEVLLKSAVALTRIKLRWVRQVEVLLKSAVALTRTKLR